MGMGAVGDSNDTERGTGLCPAFLLKKKKARIGVILAFGEQVGQRPFSFSVL